MPLYYTSQYVQTLSVIQNDLWALVNFATNFGSESVSGKHRVYLKNPDGSLPQQILRRLSDAPYPIVVVGRNYNDPTDGGALQGQPNATISQLGGALTHANYGAHSPGDQHPPIASVEVEYDASYCHGEIYWVRAADLTKTPAPPYLMLAHEFGHIVGPSVAAVPTTGGPPLDQWGNPTFGFDELAAIGIENGVRKLYHCPLRSTDRAQIGIGGCGYQGPPCKPPNTPKSITTPGTSLGRICFVVTAAHGAQATPILNGLRMLRESLLKSSRLGQAFFDAFDDEYYRTSPTISLDMQRSPTLRHAIRRWLVEPLTAFLATAVAMVSRNRLVVFPDLIRVAKPDWPERRVRLAADLVGSLRRIAQGGSGALDVPALDPLTDAFRYLRTTLRSYPQRPAILSWALLEPIEFLWTEWAGGEHDPWDGLEEFLCGWLRRMPLPRGYESQPLDNVAADLELLRTSILSDGMFFEALLDGMQAHLPDSNRELLRLVASRRRA